MKRRVFGRALVCSEEVRRSLKGGWSTFGLLQGEGGYSRGGDGVLQGMQRRVFGRGLCVEEVREEC